MTSGDAGEPSAQQHSDLTTAPGDGDAPGGSGPVEPAPSEPIVYVDDLSMRGHVVALGDRRLDAGDAIGGAPVSFEDGRDLGAGTWSYSGTDPATGARVEGTGAGRYWLAPNGDVLFVPDAAPGVNVASATAGTVPAHDGATYGTGGGDTLAGTAGSDLLYGGADRSGAGTGADRIDAGAGDDTAFGGDGHDGLWGGEGNDALRGDGGDDTIHGGAGNDASFGGDGNDRLDGGEDDDTLAGGGGADSLQGGAGHDVVDYSGSGSGVSVNLATGTAAGGDAQGDTLSGVEGVRGSAHADTLTGDAAANALWGEGGNDTLAGGAGADSLDGGAGTDTADYTASGSGVDVNLATGVGAGGDAEGDRLSGIENLRGSAHADTLTGDANGNAISDGAGNDTVYGGDGSDWVYAGAGADSLHGGTGSDTVDYRASTAGVDANLAAGTGSGGHAGGDTYAGVERIVGSAYNDTLTGDAGANVLQGTTGDDTSYGGAGNDVLHDEAGNDGFYGGDGDDSLTGGAGADTLDGGAGTFDRVQYVNSASGVVVNLATGTGAGGDAEGDRLSGVENVEGSAHNDTLTGDAGNNSLWGGAGGDDTLHGGAGDDSLVGRSGNDALQGGDGNDWLVGGEGADSIDGGAGDDTADYLGSASGVAVSLATGTGAGGDAQGDRLAGVENLQGSAHGDALTGDANANTLWGGSGDDTLSGGTGADTLFGGAGDDALHGGAGADSLNGGGGLDLADYADSGSGVVVNLATGIGAGGDAEGDRLSTIGSLRGSAHADTLTGEGNTNTLWGGAGNDSLAGGAGNDALWGDAGDDVADGGTGNDALRGGAGHDTLQGGDGDDLLLGGAGDDSLAGGAGRDSFLVGSSEGADSVDGGSAGTDSDVLVVGAGTAPVTVTFTGHEAGTYSSGTGSGTFRDIEQIQTSNGNDRVDALATSGGATIDTAGGNDNVLGGIGADTIRGGDGDDRIAGGAGADSIDGGAGHDTVEYGASNAGVAVDLGAGTGSGGHAQGDRISGVESVQGSNHGDALTGDASANTLSGAAGNDTLSGGAGNDALVGDAGNDTLAGGAGADRLDGGAGQDTADYSGSASGVTVDLAAGTGAGGDAQGDTLGGIDGVVGSAHGDTLAGYDGMGTASDPTTNSFWGGGGADRLDGRDGDDALWGGTGNDTVEGGTGNDLAGGDEGDDRLFGGEGADTLSGGEGRDVLRGGAGDDRIVTGAGADRVVLDMGGGNDRVADFDLTQATPGGPFADQIDVGDLVDADGNPVDAWDVIVTDDGHGNARLTFPMGETLVLEGVSPASMTGAQALHRAGVPCFTAGTPVAVPGGEVPVERIRPGDLVLTRDDGPRPVRWVAMRRLGHAELQADERLLPVLVAPGAWGNARPLLVSPQHALALRLPGDAGDERLARARHLAQLPGGRVRVARGVRSVTYVHLLLDRHQVLLTDGVWSESFFPGPEALRALGGPALTELLRLFPLLAATRWRGADPSAYGATARALARPGDLPEHLTLLRAPLG